MTPSLNEFKVAIIVENGVEESEFIDSKNILEQAGIKTTVISSQRNEVRAWSKGEWSNTYSVDLPLQEAHAEDYDALLLPGGVINADRLRVQQGAIALIKQFNKQEKPIAAICHAPWLLIDAGLIVGKTITSWPSLQIDIRNSGARWIDQAAVVEGNIITSRNPNDVPAFTEALLTMLGERQKALQPH
jgi:protease I